ncbi:MAG: hypothetical protein M3Z66_05245 [Chloroflexota bacterium]|nr:hypothetical protein [Chloroflexota bacterium]
MRTVEEWAVRLAAEVAPNEVDRAPEWAEAFVAGGEARHDLLARSRGKATRGMLVDPVILPFVLQAVSHAGPKLIGMVTLGNIGETLALAYHTLGLKEIVKGTHGESLLSTAELASAPGAAAALTGTRSSDGQPPAPPPADDRLQLIQSVIETMTKELRATRLSRDECDLMTFRVIKSLLDDPPSATNFVQAVSGVPEG